MSLRPNRPNHPMRPMRPLRRPAAFGRRRRFLTLLLPLSVLLVVGAGSAPADEISEERARRENSFGVDVAGRGLWKEAAYRWEKAVALDPLNPKAHNNLGVAYERAGKFEEALEAYENALELSPSSEHIRQNYELFREAYERKRRKERDAARSANRR